MAQKITLKSNNANAEKPDHSAAKDPKERKDFFPICVGCFSRSILPSVFKLSRFLIDRLPHVVVWKQISQTHSAYVELSASNHRRFSKAEIPVDFRSPLSQFPLLRSAALRHDY